MLGYLFHPRIRETTIITNWPDVLRCVATMLSGRMQPSHLLKKLAARPRQHDLALALREIGRVERTLFIIEWLLNTEMQRRAQIGLNDVVARTQVVLVIGCSTSDLDT